MGLFKKKAGGVLHKKLPFSLSAKSIRNLGLGSLVLIIALVSLMGVVQTANIEKQIQKNSTGARKHLGTIDEILIEFIEIKGLITVFVIEEQTDIKPILLRAKELLAKTEALSNEFLDLEEKELHELINKFIVKIKEYRAGMVAYSQELLMRRTGEGVRSWEKTLAEIEQAAHSLSKVMRDTIRKRINENEETLLRSGRIIQTGSIILGIIGVLAGLLVAALLQRAMARPVRELIAISETVASGDLRMEVAQSGNDEIGVLSRAIGIMVKNLQLIVGGIQNTAAEVAAAAQSLGRYTTEVSEGADLQWKEVEKASSSINEMSSIFTEITSNVKKLSGSLDQSSSSTQQMSVAIASVLEMADNVSREVEKMNSSLVQMNSNMGGIVNLLDSFSAASLQTAGTVKELTSSSQEVGRHAQESRRLAEQVAQAAKEQGVLSLEKVLEGTKKNKELVDNYSNLITSLGKRSESIGEIIDVIRGLAEQTNLLSLNAAIIAAQAGDKGKAFAVVADEIRELAETTTSNVKKIENVTQGVRSEVDEAVKMIKEIKEEADAGISSAAQASEVLNKIEEFSIQSVNKTREIAEAVTTQIGQLNEIMGVTNLNASQILKIKSSVDEQKEGSDYLVASIEKLEKIAEDLRQSTSEQSTGSHHISKIITDTHTFSQEIMRAMDEEQRASRYITGSLERITEVTNTNIEAVKALAETVNELGILSENLGPEVARFKLPDQKQGDL